MLVGTEEERSQLVEDVVEGGKGGGCELAGALFEERESFLPVMVARQVLAAAVVIVGVAEAVMVSCRVDLQNVSQLGRR